jgi:hypothetical protein
MAIRANFFVRKLHDLHELFIKETFHINSCNSWINKIVLERGSEANNKKFTQRHGVCTEGNYWKIL